MHHPRSETGGRLAALLAVLGLHIAGLHLATAVAVAQNEVEVEVEQILQQAYEAAQQQDFERTIAQLRRALEIDPGVHHARFSLARTLFTLRRYEEALAEFGVVVAAKPQFSAARLGEATALITLERYAEARRSLEAALVALPRDGLLAHALARLLASCPDPAVRDGELALRLATKVYEIKQLPETGETLAMAYAEAGQMDRAVALQQQLVDDARTQGQQLRIDTLEKRLASYREGRPWVAETPIEIAMATRPDEAVGN